MISGPGNMQFSRRIERGAPQAAGPLRLRMRPFDRHHRGIEPTAYCRAPPPGVGEIHLAVALGREAILAGHSVQFVAATTVVAQLAKGHGEGMEPTFTYLARSLRYSR